MDYYKIGEQIRKCRRAHGLSQEQLAEQVGISVTHMSHIETGNTKLSLPVLVGGGAQLMERYLRDAIPRKDIFVIPDVRANAIGYEVFANRILKERQKSAF